MRKNILLLFACLYSLMTIAQDTEFWFAAPTDLQPQRYLPNAGFVFSNTSSTLANVNIHFFKTGRDSSFTIPAGEGMHIKLTSAEILADLTQPGSEAGISGISGGVKITSDQKIIAYYLFDTGANKDIFTLKGKFSLGTEFYVPQSSDGFFLNGYAKGGGVLDYANARDAIDIIATESNTVVNFKVPRKCFSNGTAAPANFYSPGVLLSVTLQQGQVFKLVEVDKLDPKTDVHPTNGVLNTLGGTYIQSSKPITVTSSEDLTNHDMMGDQMVPAANLSTLYAVIKGYSSGSIAHSTDRVYITAMHPNTDVEVNAGSGWTSLRAGMNPGDMASYDMGNITSGPPFAVTVRSTEPVACLHSTAEGIHPAAGIVPSLYSLGQSDFSYYQMGDKAGVHNAMMLVYRAECDTNFQISYTDNTTNLPIDVRLIDPNTLAVHADLLGVTLDSRGTVPGVPGWEYMRIGLSNRADQGLVRLSNTESPFSFGYYSGCANNADPNYHAYNTYGYISTFGTWQFDVDTTWRCASSARPVTLMGGYAEYYKWILPDSSIREGAGLVSIKAYQQGRYILKMNQGQGSDEDAWTTDTCWIMDATFDASIKREPAAPKPPKVGVPQLFSVDTKITDLNYRWTFDGGTPSTSTAASASVTWNSTGSRKVTLRLSVTRGSGANEIACDTTIVMDLQIKPKNNGYFVDQNVGGGLRDGTDWDNALTTMQEALELASQGDYIWVAQGEYAPPSDQTYLINYDSVQIYGGFRGGETDLSQRNINAHPTILNGRNNSVVTFDGSTQYGNYPGALCGLSTATVLDGFIIQNGRAKNGAGILFTNGATATIANCVIRQNAATEKGGGIYMEAPTCNQGHPILTTLEISGNTAMQGAGIYNNGSDFTATHITVGGNQATTAGGGLYNATGNPDIRNSIIWGNKDASTNEKAMDITVAAGTPGYTSSDIGGSNGSGGSWNTALGTDRQKNIDVKPLYRLKGFDESEVMNEGDFRLFGASKAVNKGRNALVTSGHHLLWDITLLTPTDAAMSARIPADLDGLDRISYDIVDMGAYEYYEDAPPSIVQREIYVPVHPYLTTDPVAGKYHVRSRENFRLTLIPKKGYSLKTLDIITGSIYQDELGNKEVIYNENGTITIIFHEVTEPLNIQISGVSPVGNEAIDSSYALWTENKQLHVQTTKTGTLKVYSITGAVIRQQELTPGHATVSLPQGLYIVTFNDGLPQKVVVK